MGMTRIWSTTAKPVVSLPHFPLWYFPGLNSGLPEAWKWASVGWKSPGRSPSVLSQKRRRKGTLKRVVKHFIFLFTPQATRNRMLAEVKAPGAHRGQNSERDLPTHTGEAVAPGVLRGREALRLTSLSSLPITWPPRCRPNRGTCVAE